MEYSKKQTFCFLALPVITTHPNSNGPIVTAVGSDITLRCEAIGKGTLNYRWMKVPEVALQIKGTQLIISNLTVNDSGEYYCKVDNGGISVSSIRVNVIVKGNQIVVIYWCLQKC